MKLDEFAFLNQQLAAMLREGIPLEGALGQLSASMNRGALRAELEALEADLARGTPLSQAIEARQLPELYKRMVSVGAQSQDLAGVLTLLADYYHEQHLQWTKLKGLMTYPLIVLIAVFALSLMFHFFIQGVFIAAWEPVWGFGFSQPAATRTAMPLLVHSWIFPLGFGIALVAALLGLFVPSLREKFRWRLPAFREAGLAKIAGAMSLLLDRAVPLPEALALMEKLEGGSAAGRELHTWRERLSQGLTRFTDVAAGGVAFPPLFVWLANNSGASLAEGFRHAAEVYRARAAARAEILLHAALPVAVLTLGILIATQAMLMLSSLIAFMNMLGSMAD